MAGIGGEFGDIDDQADTQHADHAGNQDALHRADEHPQGVAAEQVPRIEQYPVQRTLLTKVGDHPPDQFHRPTSRSLAQSM